ILASHGKERFDAHFGMPFAKKSRRGSHVARLRRQAIPWRLPEAMAVVGTAIVRDEHEPFQLVDADEKLELVARRVAIPRILVGPDQAAGPAGNGPPVVAWD